MQHTDPSNSAALARFNALSEALRADSPKPDKMGAAFTALALLRAEQDDAALVAQTRRNRETLNGALGGGRSPTGSLRWVYAAVLAAQQVDPARFLRLRDTLRETRKQVKSPGLYAGGSRAALVLCLAEANDTGAVRRFFDLKKGLSPPWWRSNSAVTDTYAAAHAATQTPLDTVQADRARAEAVFGADRLARHYRRDAAKLCVLLEQDPEEVLQRFHALETGRREIRALRSRSERSLAMSWAVEGLTAEELPALAAMVEALPRHLSSTGYARARIAAQILTADRPGQPVETVAALTAVIAAQTAAMAAIIAASTVTTTTATS